MVEKWPCEKCGVPMVSTFTYCPACGQPQTGSDAPAPLVNRDVEHLRVLSICFYVLSGISALMGTLPIFHLVLGILFFVSGGPFKDVQGSGGPPPMIGLIFIGMAAFFILGGWTAAVLQFLTARNLKAHRRKGLCTLTAALSCFLMPFGTILGIFTLVVLGRPTVAPLFDAETDRSDSA